MEEIESKISGEIQDLIDDFDLNYERFLTFDKPNKDGKSVKEDLDSCREDLTDWNKIAVTCRRMIICDRELDLKKGAKLMEDTLKTFKKLKPEDLPYEAIRYANTCGLISYRGGDYSSALKHFEEAYNIAKNFAKTIPSMNAFVPDLTSNVIRTKFEFFSLTLPPGKIKSEDLDYYEKRFNDDFIEKFKEAINEWSEYCPDGKKLKLIHGHGMASLHHNLGECYARLSEAYNAANKSKDEEDAKKEAKDCHDKSLNEGKKVGDIYRQLQSKRYLSKLATDKTEREDYENEVLDGNWIRGKQMIYQSRIKESEDPEKINKTIKELRIGENEKDKIVVLYNLNAIKKSIKKGVKGIKDKDGEILKSLDIANKKINVVEKIRKEFYLLYRRQAISIIRDDVLEIIDDFWDKANQDKKYWEDVINWSERYSSRDLIELSQICLEKTLEITNEQKSKIAKSKEPIFDEDIKEINKHSMGNLNIPLSLTLGTKTYDDFLDLIIAYESVLEQPSRDFELPKQDVYGKLIVLLKKIPFEENAAVLKFLIFDKGKKRLSRALLIKRDKTIKREFDFGNVYRLIDTIKQLKKEDDDYLYYMTMFLTSMTDLLKELKQDEELKGVKNLFIIPDGELFQLPLHLIFKDIQDINVYYSPTLTHLLAPSDYNNNNKAANYLWVLCPTDDLCKDGKPIVNHPKCKHIKTLQCKDATLKSFDENYKPNIFTHVGFSTHGLFHDHTKDAYISQIMFNNSFLTPYDILLRCDFSGIQTIYLGCCEVGKSKYTDENEAIGLVTAFLSKKAVSVIAPLWKIDEGTNNNFITAVNKSGIADRPEAWNLADILGKFENPYESIPFVQYATIGIVVGRLPKEKKEEILSYLQKNDPSSYNQKETVE